MNNYQGPRQKGDSPETRAAMKIVEDARKCGKSVSFTVAMNVVKRRTRPFATAMLKEAK